MKTTIASLILALATASNLSAFSQNLIDSEPVDLPPPVADISLPDQGVNIKIYLPEPVVQMVPLLPPAVAQDKDIEGKWWDRHPRWHFALHVLDKGLQLAANIQLTRGR